MHTVSVPTFSVLSPRYLYSQTVSVMGALMVPSGYKEIPAECRVAGYRSRSCRPQQGYHQSYVTRTPNPYTVRSYTFNGSVYRVNDPDVAACGQYANGEEYTYAFSCGVYGSYSLVESIAIYWQTRSFGGRRQVRFQAATWQGAFYRNVTYNGGYWIECEEAGDFYLSINLSEVPGISTQWQDAPAPLPLQDIWRAAHVRMPKPSGWRFSSLRAYSVTSELPFDEQDLARALRLVEFDDLTLIRSTMEGYVGRAPRGQYLFEWLVQHAYMDALDAIPKACDNSIQNLQAAFDLLLALKSGNVVEIPDILWDDWVNMTRSASAAAKGLSNKWLQGRYVVATTKADIDEYVKFGLYIVDKYQQQITTSRAHGVARYTVSDGRTYECRCALNWAEKGLTGMSAFCKGLWQSGLEPNAYVLWDFVPFSFVADWFLPFGDVLETYSEANYRNSQYFDISDVVFSLAYDTEVKGITAHHYTRWLSAPLSEVDNSYWWDKGDAHASLTTTVKRCVDGCALMTGMKLR